MKEQLCDVIETSGGASTVVATNLPAKEAAYKAHQLRCTVAPLPADQRPLYGTRPASGGASE